MPGGVVETAGAEAQPPPPAPAADGTVPCAIGMDSDRRRGRGALVGRALGFLRATRTDRGIGRERSRHSSLVTRHEPSRGLMTRTPNFFLLYKNFREQHSRYYIMCLVVMVS